MSTMARSARSGKAGRRRGGARRAVAVGRTEAGKDERHGRSTASLVDSLGGEVQYGEAVRLASSNCSGTPSVAGDSEGTAAATVNMELDLGFREEEKREGQVREKEQGTAQGVVLLDPRGSEGGVRHRGGAHEDTAAWWRQCLHCRHRGDAIFTDNPLPLFFFSVFIFLI